MKSVSPEIVNGGAGRAIGRPATAGKRRRWSALGFVPPLTLALFLGPIAGGLIGTWAPSFGILPALGGTEPTLDPWRALMAAPGLAGAVLLSVGHRPGCDSAVGRDRAVVLRRVARHAGLLRLEAAAGAAAGPAPRRLRDRLRLPDSAQRMAGAAAVALGDAAGPGRRTLRPSTTRWGWRWCLG